MLARAVAKIAFGRCALKFVSVVCMIALLTFSAPVGGQQQQQTPATPSQISPAAVEKTKPAAARLKRVHVDLSGFELDKSAASTPSTQIGGGTRGNDGVTTLLAPSFSVLYSAHPVFQWSHTSQAQNFEFRLFDEKENLLYQAHVSGLEFRYPDNAPALEAGMVYGWNVRPEVSFLGSVSPTCRFRRLSQPEIDEVSSQLRRIGSGGKKESEQRAQLFVDRRLWFDSIQTLSELIKEQPNDPELFERRGTIYDQILATKALAEEDFAVADQLRLGQNP
jgi:hypothetical protein